MPDKSFARQAGGRETELIPRISFQQVKVLRMKITYRAALVVIMVTILIVNPSLMAWGNPPPGRWEKVAQTNPGEWMQIYTRDGTLHSLRFLSLEDEFLRCNDAFSEEIRLEVASISKIVVENSGRYAKQGALVGALGGAAGGLGLIGIDSSYSAQSVLIFTGITAALGAGAGYIIGAAAGSSEETIYISRETAQAEMK